MEQSKNLTIQTIRLFWQHAWKHKGYVCGLFISVTAAILTFQFLPPLIVAHILERLADGSFEAGKLWESFGPLLVIYAGLVSFGGIVLWRVVIFCIWQLEMRVLQDLHVRVFEHLMNQSADFHANRFGGSLVSQTNKLAGAYVRMADTTVFQVVGLLLSFLFAVIILAPRAPLLTIALLGFSVMFMTFAVLITKRIRELNAREASASTKQTGTLADAITNVLAVKSFSGGNQENKRYFKATRTTRNATRELMIASLKKDTVFSSMTSLLTIGALVFSVAGVVLFEANIGTVFLVIQYTSVISQRLWDFSQSALRNYNRALGDAREMVEILAITPNVTDPTQPEKNRIRRGSIVFDNVTFDYEESKESLLFKGLHLSIKPGEKVGLVGHSGGGKTTITKLLLRFMDIQKGSIKIDGQDISKITQDELRRHIAYVPQEPLLFHRSLLENIGYGRPKATEKEVVAIAKMANAHEFIQKLPKAYDTLVGERGVKLSGGQRQRVAIARAMIKNAPILVLDEATSALDSESERLIQEALWKLMDGRTAIVIAHRLSTIQKMDRIIVVNEGKIVEQGTHKELIRQNGTYAELWSHQSGGFMED
jgi:ATP-binding cassette subfamily B protein